MKKLFIFISLVLLFCVSNAQNKSYVMPVDRYTNQVVTYMPTSAIPFYATDTVGLGGSYNIDILANLEMPLLYKIRLAIAKISGTPTGKVYLKGKVFDSDSWNLIDSTTYTNTTSANLIFTKVSNAIYYRYLRMSFAPTTTAQKIQVTAAEIKFWKQ